MGKGIGELAVGKQYEADGKVPLMPLHLDDFATASLADVAGRPTMEVLCNPGFTVMERRPTRRNRTPWYRVLLADGREGWFNSIALLACMIKEVQATAN